MSIAHIHVNNFVAIVILLRYPLFDYFIFAYYMNDARLKRETLLNERRGKGLGWIISRFIELDDYSTLFRRKIARF